MRVFISVLPVDVCWRLKVALICISLMTHEVKHLLMYLLVSGVDSGEVLLVFIESSSLDF